MIIRKVNILGLVLLAACNSGPMDDPIPVASFPDIVIDINLPSYVKLRTDGQYVEEKGGVRELLFIGSMPFLSRHMNAIAPIIQMRHVLQ